MALTEEEQAVVNRLRLRTGERIGPTQAESDTNFTDAEILQVLADSGGMEGPGALDIATLSLWVAKAADYANMYDRSESGSKNTMSQLYRQAAAEVNRWSSIVTALPGPAARVPVAGKAISWLREECAEGEILWTPVRNRAYTPGNWVTS